MLYLLDVFFFFFQKYCLLLSFSVVSCFCCWVVAFLMSVLHGSCVAASRGSSISGRRCVIATVCSVSIATLSVYRLLPIVLSCMYSVYLSFDFFSFLFLFRVVFTFFLLYLLVCSHMISCRIFMSLHCFRLFVARPMWSFPFMGSTCIYACVTALFYSRVRRQYVFGCCCSWISWLFRRGRCMAIIYLLSGVVLADFVHQSIFLIFLSVVRLAVVLPFFFWRVAWCCGSAMSRGITTFDLMRNLCRWCF